MRVNGIQAPTGDCGGARALSPGLSGHGNYVVFTCEGGKAFLTYTGPK